MTDKRIRSLIGLTSQVPEVCSDRASFSGIATTPPISPWLCGETLRYLVAVTHTEGCYVDFCPPNSSRSACS